ncbi:MAG TPA: hypothetical protein VFX02_10870 [Gammaproteobacteria bacterium]|nr:hypothetical protein [Gammaproteobacteria bacterium]
MQNKPFPGGAGGVIEAFLKAGIPQELAREINFCFLYLAGATRLLPVG